MSKPIRLLMEKNIHYLAIGISSSLVYYCIAVLMLNSTAVSYELSTSPLSSSATFITSLLIGSKDAFGTLNFFLLITIAMLVGANVALSFALLRRMQGLGKMSMSFGGASVVGVFSAGCAGCGFSALSLFGASGILPLLPFRGIELSIATIALLLITLFYTSNKLQKPVACKSKR